MNCLVTTTINSPTEAFLKFLSSEWPDQIIVIGDLKTPHLEYLELEKKIDKLIYLDPKKQEKLYPKLSNAIGWNCIQRRSLGFLHAHKLGAEIIASVDDDNIPYENWGKNCVVTKEVEYDFYSSTIVFDPLSATNHNDLWHRGFPIQLVKEKNNIEFKGTKKRKVLVQADLWDGDPDIDAFERIIWKPDCKFSVKNFYGSDNVSPFNSQNTFLHRDLMPWYMMLPGVGRMDDIWASFFIQREFPDSLVFGPSTVFQDRNEQNLIVNLKDELLGYENNLEICKNLKNIENFLPDTTLSALSIYQDCF